MVMVVSALFGLGWLKRLELIKNEERLTALRWEIVQLKSKIQSCNTSLLDAFEESGFFAPAAADIRLGIAPERAVKPLGEGIKGFDLFAKGLEGETAADQIGNAEVFLKILEVEIASAKEKTEKMGKLYLGGGLMAGLALCIIML